MRRAHVQTAVAGLAVDGVVERGKDAAQQATAPGWRQTQLALRPKRENGRALRRTARSPIARPGSPAKGHSR